MNNIDLYEQAESEVDLTKRCENINILMSKLEHLRHKPLVEGIIEIINNENTIVLCSSSLLSILKKEKESIFNGFCDSNLFYVKLIVSAKSVKFYSKQHVLSVSVDKVLHLIKEEIKKHI